MTRIFVHLLAVTLLVFAAAPTYAEAEHMRARSHEDVKRRDETRERRGSDRTETKRNTREKTTKETAEKQANTEKANSEKANAEAARKEAADKSARDKTEREQKARAQAEGIRQQNEKSGAVKDARTASESQSQSTPNAPKSDSTSSRERTVGRP